MLEAALFTALGFAVAALIALMIAPAVWRQAVRITRRRIEASVPLTLNEIQADKDQLRAEFAMTSRRLEMELDKLKERAATQDIEVQRKRDQLSKAAEQLGERDAELKAALERGRGLDADLEALREDLARTEATLAETRTELAAREVRLEDYETALKAATADVDSHKVELAARDERLAGLDADIRKEREQVRAAGGEANHLRGELKAARADHERERERAARLETTLETTRARVADLEAIVERREDDITRLRLAARETQGAPQTQTQTETETEGAAAPFEALPDTPDLAEELAAARAELETQRIELAAARLAGGDDQAARRENALVRERLNDIAAHVTAMTAKAEGPDSTVDRILRETPEPSFPPEAYDTPDGKPPRSLADRIRAAERSEEPVGET